MSHIAKMNMILAGDGHSNIFRQDSYQNPQRGKFDLIITNMPFGKRMKTEYASLHGFNTNSAEVTGVLHCLDALSDYENSRAGIIAPEGILFDSSKAYTQLRRELIEKYEIKTIISLPKKIFLPNTGVKSNVLIIKKQSRKNKHIWYFNVKNDGFTLDNARNKIEGVNDFDNFLNEQSG
ncbi:hypothetical protein BKH42_05015 [Helicobacter sp. 13S00482-2]|nr:hypothetical protein BKH42_05015 [Helicobacter sp. 13S00482-2]